MKTKAVPADTPVRGKLITLEAAAEKTGLSKAWFYLRMRERNLPFAWFMPSPGKRFIDSADLDDWLRTIRVPVGKGAPM